MSSTNNLILISNDLSVTVTIPSFIPSFTVSSTDKTINSNASFNFVFKTKNFLPKDAILELIFPTELSISNLVLTSVNGMSMLTSLINYTISNSN